MDITSITPISSEPVKVQSSSSTPPNEIQELMELMMVRQLVLNLLQEMQKSQHIFQNKS